MAVADRRAVAIDFPISPFLLHFGNSTPHMSTHGPMISTVRKYMARYDDEKWNLL